MRRAAWIAGVLALVLASFNAWAVENKDINCNRDHNHFGDEMETFYCAGTVLRSDGQRRDAGDGGAQRRG